MIELCASLLAADHAYLARDLLEAERCGIKRFHFDVCDGHYTKYLIFGNQLVTDLRAVSQAFFDVHLAVFNMESILEGFLHCGAERINLQYESAEGLDALIDRIHREHLQACLSFTPESEFSVIEPYLERVEAVNLLAVNPGIGGQVFSVATLAKIEQTASCISRAGLKTEISVDGGVNRDTIRAVAEAGAHIATVGSGIFSGNLRENVIELRKAASEVRS